ncbi:DNA polymerase III subunit delta [Bacillus cereus]
MVEDARTLPFFGERKVLLIKSPLFLTSQKEKLEQNIKILEEYIGEPSPFSILVFVAPYEKLDERKKITKLLKKTADVVEANAMQIQDVQKWIVARADEVHVHIDNAAVSLLLELVGSNVTMLAKEMDKLTLYVGMGGEITTKLVAELVPKSVEQNVFALTEKVVKKDIAGAMQILDGLFTQQEEPIKLLALLGESIPLVVSSERATATWLWTKSNCVSYWCTSVSREVGNESNEVFSFEELKKVIIELAEADYSMKTGKMDKKLVLEFFLMRLNHM